jgi:NAD(P)-dependent dehydrogenase (short-subunit alcohol dehydrogenase family)
MGIGNVDVRQSEQVQAAVDECVSKLGGIDFVM